MEESNYSNPSFFAETFWHCMFTFGFVIRKVILSECYCFKEIAAADKETKSTQKHVKSARQNQQSSYARRDNRTVFNGKVNLLCTSIQPMNSKVQMQSSDYRNRGGK